MNHIDKLALTLVKMALVLIATVMYAVGQIFPATSKDREQIEHYTFSSWFLFYNMDNLNVPEMRSKMLLLGYILIAIIPLSISEITLRAIHP